MLTSVRPALNLDQMIEGNSAAHRIDALKHSIGLVGAKIVDIEADLQEARRKLALDEEVNDEDFRQNYRT